MKIRPLAKADYNEWRSLWVSYLEFYETSLKATLLMKPSADLLIMIKLDKMHWWLKLKVN